MTGRSAVRHLLAHGVTPVIIDTRPEPSDFPSELRSLECHWQTEGWPDIAVERAILSPGLSMDSCLVTAARAAGVTLLSDIDEFFEHVRSPVIGITGTNGKSTVTSLVGHILRQAGITVAVGGNLGEAALDLLDPQVDVYVLELSSFQLQRSRVHEFAAATVLNISADHLDLHGTMDDYVAAKKRIYERSRLVVYNRDDDATWATGSCRSIGVGLNAPDLQQEWGLVNAGGETWIACGTQRLCRTSELPLGGKHNILNTMFACALVQDRVEPARAMRLALSFRGLAHRFELVRRRDGVDYVNDSKATNVGATQAALAGFTTENVVLIGGGDAKGADLAELEPYLKGRVRQLVAIGRDGEQLAGVAESAGIAVCVAQSMREAVDVAARVAEPGDTVLLSPACASLDMYENYQARGDEFRDAVNDLDGIDA